MTLSAPSRSFAATVVATLGLILLVLGRVAPAATPALPEPTALTGRDWDRLSPGARNAYLSGFLAGAAAQQAVAATSRDSASGRAVVARAATLRRSGALTFPFRENVYRSHLDDYFFYENRRRETLIQVLVDMNAGGAHGR